MTESVDNEKLKAPEKYHRLIRTMATHAISTVATVPGSDNSLTLHYGNKTVEIRSTADCGTHLGLTAKKLFDFLLLLLTKYNSNKNKNKEDWANSTIRFMLEDYMRLMGYNNDKRQDRNRCFTTICEDIAKLGALELRQESGPWFGLIDGDSFISDTSDKQIKKAIVTGNTYFEVCFQDELMTHINSEGRHIVPFLFVLFSWVGQNENAYALAKRLILHHNINSRRSRCTSNCKWKMRVSNLLKCCSIKVDQHTGNVRRTFEKALNVLATSSDGHGPLIDWTYLLEGKEYKPRKITGLQLSHDDWLNLMVEFELKGPYAKTEYAARGDLDPAYRRFAANGNAKKEDAPTIMRKKRADPELYTPNPHVQNQQGLASGSMVELKARKFESLVCEQIWLAGETPPYIIKSLRDGDGYLQFSNLTLPMSLLIAERKPLSLAGCRKNPVPRLLRTEEDRALAVFPWSGGKSPFAQVGIFKSSEDELQGYISKTLIKREHDGHVYYMGRLFDLLTIMSAAGLLSPGEDEPEGGTTDELGQDSQDDWDGHDDQYESGEQDKLDEDDEKNGQNKPKSQNEQNGKNRAAKPNKQNEQDCQKSAPTTATVKPRLSQCEHNIFWNTYAQECTFRGESPGVPNYVQTTCDKLHEKYPNPDDAEMFIRSQFVMKVEDIDFTIPTVVMGFKDLINSRHDDAFDQYMLDDKERIAMLLRSVKRQLTPGYPGVGPLSPMSPLARFVRDGADCSTDVQDAVVIDCLHWPALAERLRLTEYMEDRIRFYKDEVRQSEIRNG